MPTKTLRLVILWLFAALVIGGTQFYYHPSTELSVTAGSVLFGLSVLVSWSAGRLGLGSLSGSLKLALVSLVASFMAVKAMDVAYSAFTAPAGGRFDLPLELVIGALLIGVFPALSATLANRRQK